MDKIKVSQDDFKTFWEGHHFINAALARKMGVSEGIVSGCFQHKPNRHGKPLSFSRKNIELLNQALQQIAEELSGCKLKPSTEEAATKRFINDDPAVMESLRTIGEYIRLNRLTHQVLGWGQKKCLNNISLNGPKPHVHISNEDAGRIRTAVMAIAGTLAQWKVIPDSGSSSDREQPLNNKGVEKNEWDNTSLDLWERYARFHRIFPDGLIAFSINDGFTVCEDDARLLASIDTTLKPYTDLATGRTTLWMDAAKWEQMRRACDDEFVAVTDMYPNT